MNNSTGETTRTADTQCTDTVTHPWGVSWTKMLKANSGPVRLWSRGSTGRSELLVVVGRGTGIVVTSAPDAPPLVRAGAHSSIVT